MTDKQIIALNKRIDEVLDKVLLLEKQMNEHEINPHAHQI